MSNQTLNVLSPHDPALVAIAQSRRVSPDAVFDDMYRRLELDGADTVSDGMIWEARIDYLTSKPEAQRGGGGRASGHIYATRNFGTLLGALHANGYLTGDRPDDEVLASVRRVRA